MTSSTSSSPTLSHDLFEGVKVSVGYIKSLQKSILRLEQNQQHLIAHLEHANSLASEYHETATMYHRKYDQVLHEMEEMKRKHEREMSELVGRLRDSEQETQNEKAIAGIHEDEIELLERQIELLEQQIEQQASYAAVSQATTTSGGDGDSGDDDHEVMSPVSVASPSPRGQDGCQSPTIDTESRDDSDDGGIYRDRYGDSSQTTDCSGDPICHSDTSDD